MLVQNRAKARADATRARKLLAAALLGGQDGICDRRLDGAARESDTVRPVLRLTVGRYGKHRSRVVVDDAQHSRDSSVVRLPRCLAEVVGVRGFVRAATVHAFEFDLKGVHGVRVFFLIVSRMDCC